MKNKEAYIEQLVPHGYKNNDDFTSGNDPIDHDMITTGVKLANL
jgi:hypothetical protein